MILALNFYKVCFWVKCKLNIYIDIYLTWFLENLFQFYRLEEGSITKIKTNNNNKKEIYLLKSSLSMWIFLGLKSSLQRV